MPAVSSHFSLSDSRMQSPPSSPTSPVTSVDGRYSLFNESPGALCGWLYKSSGDSHLGTAERPKRRWFVFNDETMELEYYRTIKDATKLGGIQIDEAAFLPDAMPNAQGLYAMAIKGAKKSYRVYHEERATLDYWRQALQRRRSILTQRRLSRSDVRSESGDSDQHSPTLQPHLEVEARVR